jgi:hypothetical protein
MKPFDKKAHEHERKQVEKLVDSSERWAGLFTSMPNWREWNSLTFTRDFFGNVESRALLGTLYDRICRSALCRLKEAGYDISDYPDESGRFNIKSDLIEQLVIGEEIFVGRKSKKQKDADGDSKSRPESISTEAKAS